MLEVGLDGFITITRIVKIHLRNLQIGLLARKFQVLSADAANSAFSAIREAAENGFQPDVNIP
jgi:hypothetical protein